MFYPDEVIEEVRGQNDIVDIISGYVSLKKQGSGYMGLCPFHNEKSPSFSVNRSGQYYHCFGCHKGGNVITFVMEYENFTFVEALKYLADKAGIKLPEYEYTAEQKMAQDKRAKLLEINKEAAKYFYFALRDKRGEIGKKYFTDRKLSEETMQKFGLGYSLQYFDDLLKYLRGKGYSDDILRESGLFSFDERSGMRDTFINRVMFPISDIQNRVIGFGGRVLGDAKPKYINSPETLIFDKSKNLYGLNIARASRKENIIICEGYMDVIAMHQAGFSQAVASLGTAFTANHAMLVKKYTKNVYLAYDSDGAGVTAALRNIGILRQVGLHSKVINMEPYKDPDEFIKNLGTEEFQKRIDNAENGFLFEIRKLKEKYNLAEPDEKTDFYNEIAKKLCVFDEGAERDNYMEAVCRANDINEENIRKLIIKIGATGMNIPEPVKSGKKAPETVDDNVKKLERTLLSYIANDNSLYYKLKNYIKPTDFTNDIHKKIAEILFDQIEQEKYNPAAIIGSFEDIEMQNQAAYVFEARIDSITTEQETEKAINELVISVKRNAVNNITARMGSDINAVKELIVAKQELENLIKNKIFI